MDKNNYKLYKNKIDKKLNNCQYVYSTMNKQIQEENTPSSKNSFDKFTVEQKIYNILHSKNYIYKADVTIVTKEGNFKKRIIARSGNYLITFDNEYIKIDDILDIYQ